MFNLEGFIPQLCQLAQELGEDEWAHNLRSAGLQALSSMVLSPYFHWFSSKVLHFFHVNNVLAYEVMKDDLNIIQVFFFFLFLIHHILEFLTGCL